MKNIGLIAGIILMGTLMGFGSIQEDCTTGGKIEACYQLGVAYSRGNGVTKNMQAAKMYLELACSSGLQKACEKAQGLTKESPRSQEATGGAMDRNDNQRVTGRTQQPIITANISQNRDKGSIDIYKKSAFPVICLVATKWVWHIGMVMGWKNI